MAFADLKNDFVFRRIFATHPEILRGLAVLSARGIVVSAGARAHIEACKDIATLDRWIVLAATAKSAEEIIA